jgi:hypothetical protein
VRRAVIGLALALALAACAGLGLHPPHPARPAALATPRPPCALPPAPTFPDSDAALAASSGLAERVTRLREGRDARLAYERKLRKACR